MKFLTLGVLFFVFQDSPEAMSSGSGTGSSSRATTSAAQPPKSGFSGMEWLVQPR